MVWSLLYKYPISDKPVREQTYLNVCREVSHLVTNENACESFLDKSSVDAEA